MVTKRRRPRKKGRKVGGFIPLLIAALGALGSLAGGGAAIAKAVNQAKANKTQLEEVMRHNKVIESKILGSGILGLGMKRKRRRKV